MKLEFIDNETGLPADAQKIRDEEEWAEDGLGRKADCFAVTADGDVILIDWIGNFVSAPTGRFTPRIVEE